MNQHVSVVTTLLVIAFILANVSKVLQLVSKQIQETFEVYFPVHSSLITDYEGSISESLHNVSLKGFAPCNSSGDCSYGGSCVTNHFGFILKDDFEFIYRKPNGEIKTRHWLVVDEVEKGSPADIVGGLKPGDVLEGKYLLSVPFFFLSVLHKQILTHSPVMSTKV